MADRTGPGRGNSEGRGSAASGGGGGGRSSKRGRPRCSRPILHRGGALVNRPWQPAHASASELPECCTAPARSSRMRGCRRSRRALISVLKGLGPQRPASEPMLRESRSSTPAGAIGALGDIHTSQQAAGEERAPQNGPLGRSQQQGTERRGPGAAGPGTMAPRALTVGAKLGQEASLLAIGGHGTARRARRGRRQRSHAAKVACQCSRSEQGPPAAAGLPGRCRRRRWAPPPRRPARRLASLQRLKSVDFYRKLPTDLTEATLSGAAISIATTFIILFLLGAVRGGGGGCCTTVRWAACRSPPPACAAV